MKKNFKNFALNRVLNLGNKRLLFTKAGNIIRKNNRKSVNFIPFSDFYATFKIFIDIFYVPEEAHYDQNSGFYSHNPRFYIQILSGM